MMSIIMYTGEVQWLKRYGNLYNMSRWGYATTGRALRTRKPACRFRFKGQILYAPDVVFSGGLADMAGVQTHRDRHNAQRFRLYRI
jgi:hypothetical protein